MNAMALQCPIPDFGEGRCIEEKHGHGSRAMSELISHMKRWYGHDVQVHTDAACVPVPRGAIALSITTDGHVLSPYTIPGCNIGQLAVIGSVNDTVVSGAIPYYLALQFRLTVGFPLSELQMICESIGATARDIGIAIVTGDTKVVPRDIGDGIEITSTVVGAFTKERPQLLPRGVVPGDAVIVTGELGRHYAAVAVARSHGTLRSSVTSDLRSLDLEVRMLGNTGMRVHFMRDLTRGGLLSGVCSVAEDSGTNIILDESVIPCHPAAKAESKRLGHDLFAAPNEGTMIVFVDARDEESACTVLKKSGSPNACVIGHVHAREVDAARGEVILRTTAGTERTLVMPAGESFNRIC